MVAALSLYLFRLDQPNQYIYDELYHAYTAAKLAEGSRAPYDPFAKVPEADKQRGKVAHVWDHPAFAKLPMQAGIKLFGDNPFGWRVANAIFGALGIGIFFALGRTLFNREAALYATALLLLDGLWFVESRLALNDIYLVCFLLLGYLPFGLYLKSEPERRWRFLWLTGLGLGMAIATKWSAIYSIAFVGLTAGIRELWLCLSAAKHMPRRAMVQLLGAGVTLVGSFLIIPAMLYVAAYVQYFAMGFSLADWRELQRQMWIYHTNLKAPHNWSSPWWTWPLMLRPVWYHLFIMGNPLSWWLHLPAVLIVAVIWMRGRFKEAALGLILLGYFGQWLPWSLSPRVAYFYHMLPSVPFACLALGYVLYRVRPLSIRYSRRRSIRGRSLVVGYLSVVLIGFAFFYPMFTWLPVSDAKILPLSRIGLGEDLNFTQMHYWLPTWEPASKWPYSSPTPGIFNTVRSWLQ
jgi:dolichyl-phosphate-mannose--protein O-mannosyl transferase